MVLEVRLDVVLQKLVSNHSYGLIIIDVQDDMTLAEVLTEMEFEIQQIRMVIVNGKATTETKQMLFDGDKISLLSYA